MTMIIIITVIIIILWFYSILRSCVKK